MLEEISGNAVAAKLTTVLAQAGMLFSISDSSGWPTGATAPFTVTFNRGQPGGEERVLCASRSGLTVSVSQRGIDGTAALDWASGVSVEHTISGVMIAETNAHVNTTSRDDHTQYLNNARHDVTARHTAGSVVPTATPGAVTPGSSAAQGVSPSLARADHAHSVPAYGAAGDVHALGVGDAATAGALDKIARADHGHPMPSAAAVANAVLPPGVMMPYAGGGSAPTGWLLCDGSTVSRTTYNALFLIIGTAYNTGGEAGTDFRLPNTKGRVIVGQDAGQSEFNSLGETGGEKTHVLTTAELASHDHTIDPPATASDAQGVHNHIPGSGSGNFITDVIANAAGLSVSSGGNRESVTSNAPAHAHTTNIPPFQSAANGSGTGHNNLQPYISMPHIIKT
jgi:microcystin-dependent protein